MDIPRPGFSKLVRSLPMYSTDTTFPLTPKKFQNITRSKTAEKKFILYKREKIYLTYTTFPMGNLNCVQPYFPPQHYTSHIKAHCIVYNVSVFNIFRGQTTQSKALSFLFFREKNPNRKHFHLCSCCTILLAY